MIARAVAAIVLAAGCGRTDREPAAPARDAPHDGASIATDGPSQGESEPMIDLIRDVVRFAAADRLTVERAIAQFGPAGTDEGPTSRLHLQPRDPRVRAVALTRRADGGEPYTIELGLAAPVRFAALEQAFGKFRESRTDWSMPRELVASAVDGGGPIAVALIVRVAKDVPVADAAVTDLVVRVEVREPAK